MSVGLCAVSVCVCATHKWYKHIKDQVKHRQLSASMRQCSDRYFTSQRADRGGQQVQLTRSILRAFTKDIIIFKYLNCSVR